MVSVSRLEPMAISANDLALLFSVSVRQIWSMHQAGSLGPLPVRLGARLSRWDLREIEQWWVASKILGRPISRTEWLRRQDTADDEAHNSGRRSACRVNVGWSRSPDCVAMTGTGHSIVGELGV